MLLRPVRSLDLKLLRSWRNNDKIRNWCRQVGWISEIDQEAWYKRQNDDPTIKMFVIEDKGARGVCGLTDIDLINRRAEFSLYIGPEAQGRGFAKEALRQLFDFGFKELGLHVIWGETFDGNPASKLFEKIGMKKEGTRRGFYFKNGKHIDAHLYSILYYEHLDMEASCA